MSRLIDADKLVEICRKGWKLFGREDEKLKHWVDEDDIRNQPTVKAIPIEWIEKYIWSADTHDEKRTLRKMCIQWEKEKMCIQWEKENETN